MRREAGATIPRTEVKLMIIAETVPIPHRCEPRTHGRETTIGLFDEGRIVLKMYAVFADRPGAAPLNRIKNFHASMCYNGRPVMPENDD